VLRGQIFVTNSEITYPYLLYGGFNGIMTDYGCTYDTVFVIGGDGVILWRGIFNDEQVRAAIEQGISDLEPTPVESGTWGGIKAMYR